MKVRKHCDWLRVRGSNTPRNLPRNPRRRGGAPPAGLHPPGILERPNWERPRNSQTQSRGLRSLR
eukprot:6331402-Heterocapsa_arctica.AAC.1